MDFRGRISVLLCFAAFPLLACQTAIYCKCNFATFDGNEKELRIKGKVLTVFNISPMQFTVLF